MRPVFSSVLLFAAAVSGAVTFVSPGPSVSNSDPTTSNAIHPVGSNFHVAWSGTDESQPVSIVLFQYNGTDLQYPFEYVAKTLTNETSYDWTVVTNKDLSYSHLFLLNLFYDGEIRPVAVSETFNITDTSPSSTTTTSSTSSTSSTGSTSSTSSTSAPSATISGASSTAAPDDSSSGGLSTGAKIGVGVAVPIVALLGIAAGYLLFRHRADKQQDAATTLAPAQAPGEQKPVDPILGYPYEMDSSSGSQQMSHGGQHSLVSYELYGDSTRQ
ncbi:hypothetical protein F4779DRAFT_585397 [Xylariaceae sp. FL0662B]|nr:hypothetical protein F4779DRAFT_585397 [Xylariaceae sp. FL0662B]